MNSRQLTQTLIKSQIGLKPALPINYTLGLTYNCNARCATCRIYEKPKTYTMSPKEWRAIFRSLGDSPYWVTFTGGEPFLYPDISEVYYDLIGICHPTLVNIPTNGLLTDRIENAVWEMIKIAPTTSLTINISLDHYIPGRNDRLRGVPGYTKKAIETLTRLQVLSLTNPQLHIGIHTVVSAFNVSEIEQIVKELSSRVEPSMYITEIAEERKELGTIGLPITPKQFPTLPTTGRLKGYIRNKYYKYLKGGTSSLPCQAGTLSCQIAPDGEVWYCCIKAESIGNLRDKDYRMDLVWKRKDQGDCKCPMANAFYTNFVGSPLKGLMI